MRCGRNRRKRGSEGTKRYDSLSHFELEALEVGHLSTLLASLQSLRPRGLLPLLHNLTLQKQSEMTRKIAKNTKKNIAIGYNLEKEKEKEKRETHYNK